MRKRDIRIGAPVRIKDGCWLSWAWPGVMGRIVALENNKIGVMFDSPASDVVGKCDLDGRCPDGYGYWFGGSGDVLERVKGVKTIVPPKPEELAWFDYCDQREHALRRSDREAKELFLAGWEAAIQKGANHARP